MRPRLRTWTLLLIAAIVFVGLLFWARANPYEEKAPVVEAQETIQRAFGMKLATETKSGDGLSVEEVDPKGPAANVGIEAGDRIVAVGDESVWHTYQFIEAANKRLSAAPMLALLVERKGEYRVIIFRADGPLPLPGEDEEHHH